MTTASSIYQSANVSSAAYAYFYDIAGNLVATNAQLIAALTNSDTGGKFTQAAAEEFVKNWKVVDQFTSPVPGGVDTGFSATVFERLDPATGQGTGKMYFAVRGSEGNFTDWVNTNFGDIGADGIAIKQGIDMYNYYLRLTGTKDSLVPQYQYVESTVVQGPTGPEVMPARFERIFDATASGELSSNPAITAVGHSLGGHLAMMLSRMTQSVSSVTTFNAPGFDSIAGVVDPLTSEGFFSLLSSATGQTTMTNPWQAGIMSHFDVQGDIVQFVGVTPGTSQKVFTESIDQNPYNAHLISPITDSLAVYDLFAKVDPSLDNTNGIKTITGLLKASSNVAENSLESAVSSLGELLVGAGFTKRIGSEYNTNRNQLYTDLQSITATLPPPLLSGLSIKPFVTTLDNGTDIFVPGNSLASSASADTPEGMGYRYALVKGNAFAVLSQNATFYANFNQNHELDVYDATINPNGQITDSYLTDRSAYLSALLSENIADATLGSGTDVRYYDSVHGTMMESVSGIGGIPSKYVMFGSDKADPNLNGTDYVDHLYGMGGADTLQGNGGDDYLEGGTGNDTYRYNTGDGIDTILDTDGNGQIQLNGAALDVSGFKQFGNTWTNTDQTISLSLIKGKHQGQEDLVVEGSQLGGAGNSITIQDFKNGDLGIQLPLAPKAALTLDTTNPFADPNYIAADGSATIQEQGSQRFNLALNQPLHAGDKITISVTGGIDPGLLRLVNGANIIDFTGGSITLNAQEGQDLLSFGILQQGEITQNGNVTFKASIESTDTSGAIHTANTANNFMLNVIDGGPVTQNPNAPQTTSDITGDPKIHSDTIAPGGQGPNWSITRAYNFQYSTDANGKKVLVSEDVDYFLADGNGNPTEPGGPARDDTLNDTAANDHIMSGAGKDTIYLSKGGDDIVDTGIGDDTVYITKGGNDVINTGAGDDHVYTTVTASSGNLTINGGDGRDYLGAWSGKDIIEGGAGADGIYGSSENDRLYGDTQGNTADFIAQGATQQGTGQQGEWVDAEDGNDLVVTGAGNDLIAGGDGDDLIVSGGGDDTIWGDWNSVSQGDQWKNWTVTENATTDAATNATTYTYDVANIYTESNAGIGNDTIHAGAGNDVAFGERGDDTIYLGAGNDKGWGGEGADIILGGTGNDIINGDNGLNFLAENLHGDDFLDGGAGNDKIFGMGGSDTLYGGAGDDMLDGDDDTQQVAGNDYLDGEAGNDMLYGGGGSDILLGGSGNDELYGENAGTSEAQQADDYLDGGVGDDLLNGGGGADTLIGGDGADQLFGDASDTPDAIQGDDYLDGGAGDDTLVGYGGADTLLGGAGNDTIDGDAGGLAAALHGDDYIDGGAGNDQLNGNGGADTLLGGAGDDQLFGDANDTPDAVQGDDYLDGGTGNDILTGWGGADVLIGGAGNDVLFGDGATVTANLQGDDYLDGGIGNDVLYGHGGADTLYGGDGTDTLLGGDGNDEIDGGLGNDALYGDAGDDSMAGGAGDDRLYGGAGNDYVDGGAGNDTLVGGAGADILAGGDGQDTYVLNAGFGVDRIVDTNTNGVRFNFAFAGAGLILGLGSLKISFANHPGDVLHIDGFDPNDPLNTSSITTFQFTDRTMSLQQLLDVGMDLTGTPLEDFIQGTAMTEHIHALESNDVVYAAGGNDVVDAGPGDDTVYGGDGNDTLDGGTGGDALHGDAGNDSLSGSAGNDLLDGGAGADAMAGGTGNDTYIVDNVFDTVTENANEGVDLVQSSVNRTLSANVENLTLTGGNDISGWGNSLDNTLIGNDGHNQLVGGGGNDVLDGGAGNDALFGGSGDDVLDGGAGADAMFGGTGDDTYVVDTAADTIGENAGEGTDTVQSSIDYSLAGTNLENITLTGAADINATGNAADNVLTGNSGNNILDGKGGNGIDSMAGGAGDDTYIVRAGDVVIEQANEGIDTVRSFGDYTLGDHVENLELKGFATAGTGNALDNVIHGTVHADTLAGGAGNDTLYGDFEDFGQAYNQFLVGNLITDPDFKSAVDFVAGGDVLDGGAGADVMVGGIGDDTYIVDDASDQVIEKYAGYTYVSVINGIYTPGWNRQIVDIDTVNASVSHALSTNVENLNLTGTADINGTGNALDNVITGNSGVNTLAGGGGNDRLDGGAGADVMDGGAGDDTYYVDNAGDVAVENAPAGGHDKVNASVDFTLGANIEDLQLTGNAIRGAGNTMDNVITGNDMDNTLVGDAGNDRMDGGAGNDSLNGGVGNDTLNGGAGADVMNGGIGTDVMDGGVGNDVLNGDAGNDFLNGGAGNDALNGGAGNDFLNGGAGNDALNGEAGNDTLNGGLGNDFLNGGAGNDSLNGGVGADAMAGGIGNDTYIVDNAGDTVIETSPAGGLDSVNASVGFTLGANIENLQLTGNAVSGTGNALDNVITGNDIDNTLSGLGGNDTLSGAGGNDTVDGGAGDDTIYGGTNGIFGGGPFPGPLVPPPGPGPLPRLLSVVRSAVIIGGGFSTDSDTLYGGAGNDTIDGGADNDIIDGGAGDDRLLGGQDGGGGGEIAQPFLRNRDTIDGGAGNDYIDGQSDADTLNGGTGDDTIFGGDSDGAAIFNQATGTYTALSNVDTIDGGAGNDTIDGGAGNDQILGGAGDDVIHGGADGYIADVSGGWPATVLDTNDDFIDGGDGNDTIDGGSGADMLFGGAGNDVIHGGDSAPIFDPATGNMVTLSNDDYLDGGSGIDTMTGGLGNDTYIVDGTYTKMAGAPALDDCDHPIPTERLQWTTDTVVENTGEGFDTVRSSASFVMSDNIERLELTLDPTLAATDPQRYADLQAFGQDGAGNALDNEIIGNALKNRIDGGAGADLMDGGTGNDTYVVDNAGDTIIETTSGGNDTVESSINYALGDPNLENLTLLNGAASGRGNAGDNIIRGNAADNVLEGMAGNDKIYGGAGNDTLRGGAGDDVYMFRLGDGADRIEDAQGNNTLHIGSDLTLADLKGTRTGNDAVVSIAGTGDSITLVNWFNQPEGVNRIVFCDGTSLDHPGMEKLFNRPPVANPDLITAHEDGGLVITPAATLLANDTDPDPGDVLTVKSVGTSTVGAAVSLVGGKILYDIGNGFQQLREGEILKDSFAYTISDKYGATATSVVNVNIIGTNDAPIVAADVAAVQEDVILTATGNVLTNDHDIDQGDVLSVANAGIFTGNYGTLTLNADGSYAYELDNASKGVQSLAEGQVVTESFDYQATDGLAQTPSTLTVSITGTNDAPVVNIPLSDQAAFEEVPFSYQLPANAFTDIDQGDVLSYSATMASGDPLPGWLAFDPASQTFNSDLPDGSAAGIWNLRVTATDQHGASAFSDFQLDVADLIRGTREEDVISGSALRDVIYGFGDDDVLSGLDGRDVLIGGSGSDILKGGAGDDILIAGEPMNLPQLGGAPLLAEPPDYDEENDKHHEHEHGDEGKDHSHEDSSLHEVEHGKGDNGEKSHHGSEYEDGHNNHNHEGSSHHDGEHGKDGDYHRPSGNLLNGGAGNDRIYGGHGNDMLIGGTGNDLIHTGSGNNVIAFNLGDGNDTVVSAAESENTISLGGGINFDDLALRQQGNDLILDIGAADSITFRDWYASADNQSVEKLQIISKSIEHAHDDDHHDDGHKSKRSKLRANVHVADFGEMVEQFDEGGAMDRWSIVNAELDKHLGHSNADADAVGGAIAGQYALTGTLDLLSTGGIQDVLDSSKFGSKAQHLKMKP